MDPPSNLICQNSTSGGDLISTDKLKEDSDLITILIELDQVDFNIIVDYIKGQPDQKDNRAELGRLLCLRRIDPMEVSKQLISLVNSSLAVKQHFIQGLKKQKIESAFVPVKQKIIPNQPLPIIREIDEKKSEVGNSGLVRPPIPSYRDRLIKSTRPNYLPLEDLISKMTTLNSYRIKSILYSLHQSKFLSLEGYQQLMTLLSASKELVIKTLAKMANRSESCLQKLAGILWGVGINIYSCQEVNSIQSPPEIPVGINIYSCQGVNSIQSPPEIPNLQKKISPPARVNGSNQIDAAILRSWNLLHQNLTPDNRQMIGKWIGLSDDDVMLFRACSDSIQSFLPDRLNLVRAIDALKAKYKSTSWLIELAELMRVQIGESTIQSIQVSLPEKLSPIRID